jgi:hypothetical protein
LIEHLLPGFPTVPGPEDTTFLSWAKSVAHGGDKDNVRVVGVDSDTSDMQRIFETDMFPGLAAVDGLVHPVAPGDALAQLRLTEADVHDVRVLLIQGDGAHRSVVELPLADGHPVGACILRLPEPSRRVAEIEDLGIGRVADYRSAPAAVEGTDVSPLQRLHLFLKFTVL